MKNALLILFLIIGINNYINAQYFISGKVVDKESSLGLPNANVQVKGTGTGTSTDQNGRFVVQVSNDGNFVILISHIGYRSAELTLKKTTALLQFPWKG
jgi:FAD synthase